MVTLKSLREVHWVRDSVHYLAHIPPLLYGGDILLERERERDEFNESFPNGLQDFVKSRDIFCSNHDDWPSVGRIHAGSFQIEPQLLVNWQWHGGKRKDFVVSKIVNMQTLIIDHRALHPEEKVLNKVRNLFGRQTDKTDWGDKNRLVMITSRYSPKSSRIIKNIVAASLYAIKLYLTEGGMVPGLILSTFQW